MQLSARDRALLDFERTWWQAPGPKGSRIRTELGCSPTRYYERLAALRLRRLRDQRRRARFEGTTADPRSR
jgi:hypothetical protein